MRLLNASAAIQVKGAGLGASQEDGSHQTWIEHEMWGEMQPVPHLMLEKAAAEDAGVGKCKDALRRQGHS